MPVRHRDESVLQWIEDTAARNLTPSDIPSCAGRNTAGWTTLSFKISPDMSTLIDKLKEHPALRNKFETRGHVGWTLAQIGAAALYRYMRDDWRDQDDIIHSLAYQLSTRMGEWNQTKRREEITNLCETSKRLIEKYLSWGTAEGKYLAFKQLDEAVKMRDYAVNRDDYDSAMLHPDSVFGEQFDKAQALYRRMISGQAEEVYIELTEDYHDELQSKLESSRPAQP